MDRRILEGPDYVARACKAKLAFRSRAAARKWIREHSAQRKMALNIYKCSFCPDWHMTRLAV